MPFQLLVDLEAIETLNALPVSRRREIFTHLRKIQAFPHHYSDATTQDSLGRILNVSVIGKWRVLYWIDHPDKQIKILEIAEDD